MAAFCFSRPGSAVKAKIGLAGAALALLGFGPCGGSAKASAATTGVPACDAYADKFEACIERMIPEEREARAAEAESQRNVMRDQAKREGARAALAAECANALAALKDCPELTSSRAASSSAR